MRRVFSSAWLLLALGVGATSAYAVPRTVVRRLPMPMTAPLFLESETYSSTLYLVNSLSFGMDASVTIYDMSGALLINRHYYIEPNAQRTIAIKQVLTDGGIFSQAGSVGSGQPAELQRSARSALHHANRNCACVPG